MSLNVPLEISRPQRVERIHFTLSPNVIILAPSPRLSGLHFGASQIRIKSERAGPGQSRATEQSGGAPVRGERPRLPCGVGVGDDFSSLWPIWLPTCHCVTGRETGGPSIRVCSVLGGDLGSAMQSCGALGMLTSLPHSCKSPTWPTVLVRGPNMWGSPL